MAERPRSRRRYLAAAGSAGLAAISGCLRLSDSAPGSETPTAPPSNTVTDGTASSSTDASTTPSGPGGDASMTLRADTGTSNNTAIEEFQAFEVTYERLFFEAEDGATPAVTVGTTLDLTTFTDPGTEPVLAEAVAFPSGTYVGVGLFATVERAVRTDGTDLSSAFAVPRPKVVPLDVAGENFRIQQSGAVQFTIQIQVRNLDGDWVLGFGADWGTL